MRDVGEEIGFGALGRLRLLQGIFGQARRALGILPCAVQRPLGMPAVEQLASCMQYSFSSECSVRCIGSWIAPDLMSA